MAPSDCRRAGPFGCKHWLKMRSAMLSIQRISKPLSVFRNQLSSTTLEKFAHRNLMMRYPPSIWGEGRKGRWMLGGKAGNQTKTTIGSSFPQQWWSEMRAPDSRGSWMSAQRGGSRPCASRTRQLSRPCQAKWTPPPPPGNWTRPRRPLSKPAHGNP